MKRGFNVFTKFIDSDQPALSAQDELAGRILIIVNFLKIKRSFFLHYSRLLHKNEFYDWLIDCMVAYALLFLNIFSVVSRWTMHLFMVSWNYFYQYSARYSSQANGCFSKHNSQRGINPVAMPILGKNIGGARNRTFCSQVLYATDWHEFCGPTLWWIV